MAVKVDNKKCTGCSSCQSACPVDAIEMKHGKASVNESCVECGACLSACPTGALTL